MKVAVVGAGISGLMTAWELQKLGVSATVFEASGAVGGPMRTVRSADGFMAEEGPHTLLDNNPAVGRVIDELGLDEQRIYASEASKTRYMVKDGKAVALPGGPPGFIKSDIWSAGAKLKLLGEPFRPRRTDGIDESVTNYVRRRMGEEFLDYGLELLVNGIWAGDPNRLSAKYAFRKMYGLERDYGSLIVGGVRARKHRAGANPRMVSFRDGNGVLPTTIAAQLDDLRLNKPVKRITRAKDGQFKVGRESFDAAVVTVGAPELDGLDIADVTETETRFTARVHYPEVAVVTLGFKRADVAHPLDGFGMIAPGPEKRDILGALFSSSLFEGRAPEGHVTLAVFFGGMRRPDLWGLSDDERLEVVMRELRRLLGVRADPVFEHQARYERAIPQYEVGWGRNLADMQTLERAHPGLYLAGNLRQGVAIPDLLAAAQPLARRIVARA